MGWEKRPGTDKLYYTRTRRAGRRRVREYFGSGPLGEIAWLVDLLWHLDAELARRKMAAR